MRVTLCNALSKTPSNTYWSYPQKEWQQGPIRRTHPTQVIKTNDAVRGGASVSVRSNVTNR
eukprot:4103287-Prorocentrum_lima.AAC.1